MTDLLWFLTRASGIVALVLIAAAVADGLIFSGREGGRRLRPAWWLDLHRGLGGTALFFTGLHLATAFGADLGVSLASIVVPGAATSDRTAYTYGVLAFYGMAVTVFSSWPRRLLRRRTWHVVHLLSIPAGVLAAVHAYQLGTDVLQGWYLALCIAMTAAVTYPVGLRLTGVRNRAAARDRLPTPASTVH
ncbi:MAG: ferric reductase-like transmembrane domain-containing protein [Ilumatobacteraceae bacterium]